MTALTIVVLVAWAIALAKVDFAEHRLPDVLTLPAIPASIAVVAQSWPDRLGVSLQWGITLVVAGVIAAIVADLGWGDVKLLGSLGVVAGGSDTVDAAAGLMCVIGMVHVVIHGVFDGNRAAHIPFGPTLLTGFVPAVTATA